MAEPLLALDGIAAFYGKAQILEDVSLSVAPGEVLALLGRNGAGKTTTMRATMQLLRPRAGAVRFAGRDITGQPAHRVARLGLGYVPEERRIFTDLTVRENLEVGRQPAREGAPSWTEAMLFELFPNLAERAENRGKALSGGEQQMLSIARTLMGNPACVLLDEPSEGIAPVIVAEMAATIRRLKAEGLAVVLSEQNLAFAGAVADTAVVLDGGRVRFAGAFSALMADEDVRQAYLAV
ncbi:MAG: ABC transporter ATP-binding protein [Pseudomonadota bacterium]